MITVNEAFAILENCTFQLKTATILLAKSRSYVLAETLLSPINMPPFRQSNMDGFALCLHAGLQYQIVGEIKAGDENHIELKPGEALKIFTGAAVPASAQAVIQIEKASVNGTKLLLEETILPETNVRPMGSQILKGSIALKEGSVLNPAAIGFLASLGFTSVKVYRKPTVGIVITGNELVPPGSDLPYGKVYESNGTMLQAALQAANFKAVSVYHVNDDFESTMSTLQKAIAENDFAVVSGGISVGDYDFVSRALESLAVETLFYKVTQKPGKPLFAGKYNEKIIFALPGNPAAALTCFYIHVLPTLRRFSGYESSYQPSNFIALAHDYEVSNTRELFLKARMIGLEVAILPHQDSSMLDSFARTDALVYLPSGNYRKAKGEQVAVYPI